MTTKMTLTFVKETPLARLYRNRTGTEKWVPRSVTTSCIKPHPTQPGDLHEVRIEDWWLKENPWSTPTPGEGQEDLI
jgi:hypothetical protein